MSSVKASAFQRLIGWLAVLPPIAVAVGFSAAFHGALILGLSFSYPDAAKAMREKALDIILVNARSA
ncbi:MAG: hypothetical protein ACOYB3_17940, partial [Azonexus sp.]